MGLAWFYLRLFGADDGTQPHLCVHVFMDGRHAVAVPCPPQIYGHAAIPVYSIMAVVDAGFGYAILCGDIFVGSSFFLMEANHLLFKSEVQFCDIMSIYLLVILIIAY